MARQLGLKTDITPLLLAIPAMFDTVASSLLFVALTKTAASVYQMMRGLIVFFTAMFSIAFLRRRLYRHHVTSLLLIVGGVALVGAGPIVLDTDTDGETSEMLGIILIIISQVFHGFMFITEEKLFSKYYLKPLKVVGFEGLWGFLVYVIILIIFQQIDCHNPDFCEYGYLEDSIDALHQIGNNPGLLGLVISVMFSIAMFNFFGVSVTKYASSAQRATLDISRTVLIWVFFLAYPGDGSETFNYIQLLGFLVLIVGTLVYNEIVVVPFWGFNLYTKDALRRLDTTDESRLTDFQGTVAEPYDYSRMEKKISVLLRKQNATIKERSWDSLDRPIDKEYKSQSLLNPSN